MRRVKMLKATVAMLLVTFVGTAWADELTDAAKEEFAFFAKKAVDLVVPLGDQTLGKASPDPLINWTIDSSWHGSNFVWLADGVPKLVGCYLADSSEPDKRVLYVELHLLTTAAIEPLSVPSVSPFLWKPDTSQVTSLVLNDVQAVHAEAGLRLKQMRDLARRFSVVMYRENRSDSEELRLLPKPIYRFPNSQTAADDGALFAFVAGTGTDPELILQVRAVGSATGPLWSVTPLRSTSRELVVKTTADGAIVWSVPQYDWADYESRTKNPYCITVEYSGSRNTFERLILDAKTFRPEASQTDAPATKPLPK